MIIRSILYVLTLFVLTPTAIFSMEDLPGLDDLLGPAPTAGPPAPAPAPLLPNLPPIAPAPVAPPLPGLAPPPPAPGLPDLDNLSDLGMPGDDFGLPAIPATPPATPMPKPTLGQPNLGMPTPFPTTPVTPTQSLPTASTPGAPNLAGQAQTHQQELTKISTEIDALDAMKRSLKQQLSGLDQKLHDAQNKVAEAKKMSFEILNKGDDAAAQQALETVKKSLAAVQAIQQEIATKTSQEFSKTANEIKTKMSSIQTQMRQLDSKGSTLKAQLPQKARPGIPAVTPPATDRQIAIPTQPQPARPKSLVHYTFGKAADLVTGSINLLGSFLSYTRDLIIPPAPQMPKDLKLKTDVKKKPLKGAPVVVGAPPQAPGQPIENQIKTQLSQIDQLDDQIDAQRLNIKTLYKNIKKQTKDLSTAIETSATLKGKLDAPEPLNGPSGAWKEHAQKYIMLSLNFIEHTLKTAQKGVMAVYQPLARSVNQVIKDVRSNLGTDKKPGVKKSQAPTKPAPSTFTSLTQPAMPPLPTPAPAPAPLPGLGAPTNEPALPGLADDTEDLDLPPLM